MWSEVEQVARDEKGRCGRWDGEWRIGVREKIYRRVGDVMDRGERWSGGQLSWDRAATCRPEIGKLYAHAHIGAAKRRFDSSPLLGPMCVSS
jgi:hypothetical protein